MDVAAYLNKYRKVVDGKLGEYLPRPKGPAAVLSRAMRYSVFSKGKRIRPILSIAAAKVCGGSLEDVIRPACALEIVHAYTLIHDDLPAMDDDDYRRGKPSCHKKFGEANAILAGDALMTLAFNILAAGRDPAREIAIIRELSEYIGTSGTVAGQVVDMATKGRKLSKELLDYINIRKTAYLIAASVKIGAIASGASKEKVKAMERFGLDIGLVFQIVDDIIDSDGYARSLGKEYAFDRSIRLTRSAVDALKIFGPKAAPLKEIAAYLLERKT